MNGDKTVYLRIPKPIIDFADEATNAGLYSNRAEAFREILRAGMKSIIFFKGAAYCIELKRMVDCCHDDECKYMKKCKIFTTVVTL